MLAARSLDVAAAEAALRGAEGDRIAAGKRPNPVLSVSTTNINPSKPMGRGSLWNRPFDTVIRVDQLLERGDKRALRSEAAGAVVDATRWDRLDTMRQAELGLAAAYWELHGAEARLRNARRIGELQRQSLHLAELRLKAGDIARLDVLRLRMEAARYSSEIDSAVARVRTAQVAVAALLNLPSEGGEAIETSDTWPALTEGVNTASAASERPDVIAARARLRAAEGNIALANALKRRDVTVGVLYEHFPPENRNMYGVGISVPLYTDSRYEGEMARARADRDAAESRLLKAQSASASELARARAALQAAVERLRRYEQDILPEARQTVEAARLAYRAGGMSLTDSLDAQRALKQAEDETIDAHVEHAKALAFFRTLTAGGPQP